MGRRPGGQAARAGTGRPGGRSKANVLLARPAREWRAYDAERYKDRNLAERFWSQVKQFRRVATRYEKTARNFLAFVQVASTMVLLR